MLRRSRRWFLKLALARKLTLLATATSAVSMTVLCSVLGWYDASVLRERLVEDTSVVLDMVAANSTATLEFGDAIAAAETLRTVGVNQQIVAAAIVRPGGRVLARYERNGQTGQHPAILEIISRTFREQRRQHVFLNSTLAMSSPITLNGELTGAVYVELELSELNARLWTLWGSLAFGLLGTIALAGAIGWRLQRVVSAPLLHLTETARAVIRDRSYGLRVAKVGDDEVGELVKAFNEMLDHIQQRDAKLEGHRMELERMVDVRTAELSANLERYRLLVESTHAIPWEVDGRTFGFSYISPQATKLLGYDKDALEGRRSLLDLVHTDDRTRIREQLTALASGRSPEPGLDVDHRLLTAQSRVIDVRSVVTADHQGRGGSVVLRGITVDVTRQKKLEMELRQAQKLESVGRLAAGVAHEINTPVQFVSDSVHFVRDAMRDMEALIRECQALHASIREDAVTPEQVEGVARAAEHADLEYLMEHVPKALDRSLEGLGRVAAIVRSMKEFAHPDRTQMTPTDLNQAIRSTLTIACNEYKYVADVTTQFGDIPLVTCHAGDVNQVILNILVNAAHAIEDVVKHEGGRGQIAVQTHHAGDDVLVSISDTGGGIPEEIRERVFDPFFTTKDVGKGTGQGLALARAVIVDRHGGELTFETQMGKGTKFVVRLPIEGRVRESEAA
jgi:PAS domain S-box-containing protein